MKIFAASSKFFCWLQKKIARPPLRAAGGLTESEVSSRFVRVRRALRDANRNKTIWRLPIRFILLLFISSVLVMSFWEERAFSLKILFRSWKALTQVAEVWISKTAPFHLAMVRHAKRSIFKSQRLKWSHTSHARKVVESSFYLQIDRGLEREHSPGQFETPYIAKNTALQIQSLIPHLLSAKWNDWLTSIQFEWQQDLNSISEVPLLASWSGTTGLLWEQYAIHLSITVTLIYSIRMHYIRKFQISRPWTFFASKISPPKKIPQKFLPSPKHPSKVKS